MHMAPRVVHFALLSSTTTSTKTTASIQALDLISSHKQNMTSSSKALISIACQTAWGLSAPFFHTVDQYSELTELDSSADPNWFIIQHRILELIGSKEAACVWALNSKDYDERSPAHAALRTKDSDRLGHLLLKNIVFNWVLYAINPNSNIQLVQLFFESPIDLTGDEPSTVIMRNVFATYTNWTTTWSKHCDSWSVVSDSRSSGTNSSASCYNNKPLT